VDRCQQSGSNPRGLSTSHLIPSVKRRGAGSEYQQERRHRSSWPRGI